MLSSSASEPLGTTTILKPTHLAQLIGKDCKSWALAAPLGVDRLGYLQRDLYFGRLFFPRLPGAEKVEIIPHDGELEIKTGDQIVADLRYWNVDWGPTRPHQFEGNCGTALISRGTGYREGAELSGPVRSFYRWQIRTLTRENTHEEFVQKLISGVTFI